MVDIKSGKTSWRAAVVDPVCGDEMRVPDALYRDGIENFLHDELSEMMTSIVSAYNKPRAY